MAISRKSTEPTGVTNSSGQPELIIEIDGLTLSMTPPPATSSLPQDDDADDAG